VILAMDARIEHETNDALTVLEKVSLIVKHFDWLLSSLR